MRSLSMPDVITGTVNLTFRQEAGVTLVEGQQSTGLLRASRPIYRGARRCPEIQLIHLGPGSMNGDGYAQRITLHEQAEAIVGFQSYNKVLPGMAGSSQRTDITLGASSRLTLKPNVVLPYPDAVYTAQTDVQLGPGAIASIAEILVGGQTPDIASLAFGKLSSTLRVFRGDKLILRDAIQIGRQSLGRGRIWADGFSVLGSVYLIGDFPEQLEQNLREHCGALQSAEVRVGVSYLAEAGFVLRILGTRIQLVERVIERAYGVIDPDKG